ncbi:molybdate ABC transporter substrate-binding protein [Undibacterium sp. LX15W]|uniref:Molybdate ABC transporter substrate-binding protein n=2 Tax=Undibacterium flavidum TaxID=2762297 RepID=A0ABR6Y838_9BURK|nr:molybdate ABC transporter substrate-binding protein [Undibacterium flavidum]
MMHSTHADTLSVAVAANVQFAFDDLKEEFKKQTGHDLKGVFNSSGKFVSQIINGAPFDVFMSADMDFPNSLYQQGFTITAPKIYAYGSLVLWTTKNLDLQSWQSLLQSDKVQKIAIANPKTAPYGKETIRVLKFYKLDVVLEPRFVYAESISQADQYIHSGVVDLGFTAKSVVVSSKMQGKGQWIELPANSYTPIAQGVVILKHGQENAPQASQQFYDFLSSAKAKAILQKNGYAVP